MTKSDYNSEFEENRKEIDLGEKATDELPSRIQLRQKKNGVPGRKKKKSRKSLTLINVILVLFTLIPIGIFVYVLSDLYNPKGDTTVDVEKSGVTFELGSSQSPNSSKEAPVDPVEDKNDSDNGQSAEDDEKTVVEKPDKKTDVTPAPKPEVKPDPKPDKKPDPKPSPKPDPKPQPKPDPKPDPKPEVKPAGKSHTVAPNETLYRISVNYYGSGSGVEKIKAANGLSSNSISVGQTLVIP